MVPRLLALLALLPLLLPPGLCACHSPLPACAGGMGGPGLLPLVHLCLQHDCHGHDQDNAGQSGAPQGHAPGCPAAFGHSAVPFSDAVHMEAPDLGVPAVRPDASVPFRCATPFLSRLGSTEESSPLYLTLRSIRI